MADKELTFWDHLDELRRVLFRVLGVWFVLAVGYFIAMPWLFDNVVLAPCHNDFVFYDVLRYVGKVFDLHDDFFTQDFHVKLININLAAPFFIHMSTAFWMSVVTATPYIFFEIWRFLFLMLDFAPGLDDVLFRIGHIMQRYIHRIFIIAQIDGSLCSSLYRLGSRRHII